MRSGKIDDLYAVPMKRKHQKQNVCTGGGVDGDGKMYEMDPADEDEDDDNDDDGEEKGKTEDANGFDDKDENKDLPPGWEKHEGMCFVRSLTLIKYHVDNPHKFVGSSSVIRKVFFIWEYLFISLIMFFSLTSLDFIFVKSQKWVLL